MFEAPVHDPELFPETRRSERVRHQPSVFRPTMRSDRCLPPAVTAAAHWPAGQAPARWHLCWPVPHICPLWCGYPLLPVPASSPHPQGSTAAHIAGRPICGQAGLQTRPTSVQPCIAHVRQRVAARRLLRRGSAEDDSEDSDDEPPTLLEGPEFQADIPDLRTRPAEAPPEELAWVARPVAPAGSFGPAGACTPVLVKPPACAPLSAPRPLPAHVCLCGLPTRLVAAERSARAVARQMAANSRQAVPTTAWCRTHLVQVPISGPRQLTVPMAASLGLLRMGLADSTDWSQAELGARPLVQLVPPVHVRLASSWCSMPPPALQ